MTWFSTEISPSPSEDFWIISIIRQINIWCLSSSAKRQYCRVACSCSSCRWCQTFSRRMMSRVHDTINVKHEEVLSGLEHLLGPWPSTWNSIKTFFNSCDRRGPSEASIERNVFMGDETNDFVESWEKKWFGREKKLFIAADEIFYSPIPFGAFLIRDCRDSLFFFNVCWGLMNIDSH